MNKFIHLSRFVQNLFDERQEGDLSATHED